MKQKISVLMDGELFEDEAASLLDHIKRDSDLHKDWGLSFDWRCAAPTRTHTLRFECEST